MESNIKHQRSLLMQSVPKHDPPLAWIYERFLELPVPVVLAAMWLAGVALISFCGLSLYYFWLLLQAVVAGATVWP
jgi:hypothetical protein